MKMLLWKNYLKMMGPVSKELHEQYVKEVIPFWKKYNLKPAEYWFRYFSQDGIHTDPRYIPEDLFFGTILPYYSNMFFRRPYEDKCMHNVLFPDLQYHGYSGGDAIQMGWKDRLDLEKWIEVAHDIFQDDFMVLHGVSMGAATVMMASGDPLPDYVRCFVEDCGYTSAWDQFASTLKQRFRLPPFPLLNSASIVTRKRYGWGFKDASSVEQLHKCVKPMLFIHGDADDFVPFAHLEKNFRAKWHGYKEKWEVPGAVHANSYAKYPEEYTRRVENFLKTVHNMIEDGSIYDK